MADENDAPEEEAEGEEQQELEELGDAGKKALDAERSARSKAEKALKAAERELAKVREANQSEAEKALAAAKAEGAAEATQTANGRLIKATAIAAAAGVLRNPKLAPQLIDLSEITVDDDGEVDTAAIEKALGDLVKSDPYLAADAKGRHGNGGGGARQASSDAGPDMNSILRAAAGRNG